MSIIDVIETRRKYDRLCKDVVEKTNTFFRELVDEYDKSARDIHTKLPGSIQIVESSEKSYRFKILNHNFALTVHDEVALVDMDAEINKRFPTRDFIEIIVNEPEVTNKLAGCITLTAKLDIGYVTIMRIFVNHKEKIAYEYGIGWRHDPIFTDKGNIGPLMKEEFFENPITWFVLGEHAKWSPIKDIRITDNVTYLKPNKIGFTPAP